MSKKTGNLIVNYLPQNMTESELYSMFVTVGQVESCKVMRDLKTGYSYGFGFVNYSRPEDAEKAIQTLNGQEIHNKRLKVSYARPSGDDIKDTNLYVTNLPLHYTESDLETLFEPFGTIVQKNLLLDKLTKFPRGVAFVRLSSREEAQEAIRNLDQQIPDGGNERLSVRVAETHSKQKAAYYAGWQAALQQSQAERGCLRGGIQGGRGVIQGGRGIIQGGRGGIQGGRGVIQGGRGGIQGGRGSFRGGRIPNNNYNNHRVFYPITQNTNNGFGALRQEKIQQRYNPLSSQMSNNGYSHF